MPILRREDDLHPADLFEWAAREDDSNRGWWAIYTLSRREKELMRRLKVLDIAFYCPIIAKRNRSAAGRVRTSYVPLFPNYVFLYGDNSQRHAAMKTGCISRYVEVEDGSELTRDLRQIHRLIDAGVPLVPETKIESGMRVRVRSGALEGQEGVVIKRQQESRILVAVNFLQQGASVLLDDFEVEWLDH